MAKVKVLNVITGGLGREGISTTQVEFMRAMNKTNLQIDIAAVHDDDPEVVREFVQCGCRVIAFPDRKRNTIKYMIALAKAISKEKYDVIHVHGSSSIMIIELFVAKILGVQGRMVHSRNTRADHKKAHELLKPLFQKSYNYALACGEDAGKWLFGDKEFYTIHNGKNLDRFKYSERIRNDIRKKFSLEEVTCVGFVGSFNEQKNIPFLLDIIQNTEKSTENIRFVLMGDGPRMLEVKEFLRSHQLEDKVLLTGQISCISEMLQAMDMMVLPSFYEGLPNVVLEWQAAGLKSFVSDTVTKECAVCDLVEFLPINQGAKLWVDKILNYSVGNREEKSEMGCRRLQEEKFEIGEAAEFVRQLYFKAAQSK